MKGTTTTHILLIIIVAVIVLSIIFMIASYVMTKGANFTENITGINLSNLP